MQSQSAFAAPHIEAVAKEFQSDNVGAPGLFAVDLEFQCSLYELGDTLFDALSARRLLQKIRPSSA